MGELIPRRRTQDRAVHLLAKILGAGWWTPSSLASELVVNETTLAAYLADEVPMPLDRQLCLALFVIENVPALARLGHRLHGQVEASIAFHLNVTATHKSPPPRSARLQ